MRVKKTLFISIALVIVVLALLILGSKIQSENDKDVLREDLTRVAEKFEQYKSDNGRYPTSSDIKAGVLSDPKYALAIKDHSDKYLGPDGLRLDNNFFYCTQDNPAKYVLLAIKDYDYAVYITEGMKLHEYDLGNVAPQDYPDDYPIHIHANASQDICPIFLPSFTDSSNGATIRDGWAAWTGVR